MQILKCVTIFLSLFITQILSCQKGCLTCNLNNECLLCDNVKFYVLEDKTCIQKTELQNCLHINAIGQCLQCQSNYFLDQTTQKCVIVPASEQILHCELYDTNKRCQLCSRNRYFLDGECKLVAQQIDFCRSQYSDTQCNTCEDLYLLDIDKQKCLRTTGVPFCGGYNLYTCINCKEGYFLNKNAEIEENISLINSAQRSILSQILNDVYSSSNEFKRNKVCQKITVENCKENLTFDKCEVCKEGSFLNSNLKCTENPLPAIANCKVYKTATQCIECQDRYYLSSNICKEIENIENCILYDGTRQTSVCKQCREGFYSNGNQCVERTKTQIQNCQIYSNDKDRCFECQNSYIISSDGLKCFTIIENCDVYNITSSSNQQISCQKCKEGYYLQDQFLCVIGTDNNCSVFTSVDQCQICKNGFYLNSNNKCDAQPTLPNCEQYSRTIEGECKQCKDNYFNFKVEQYCEFQTPISNCEEYSGTAPLQCTKCIQGYYLLSNQCALITIQNCLEQRDNNCIVCAKGFALATINNIVSCVEPFTFTKANCDKMSVQQNDNSTIQLKDNQCVYCQSYHYPIDFGQHYTCVKDDNIKFLDLTISNLVSNCLKFTNQGICLQCEKGYYLEGDKCVQNCQFGVYKLINYDKVLQNGIYLLSIENNYVCTSLYQSEGVEILGIDLFFSNPNELDIIIQCQANRLPVVDLGSQKYTNMKSEPNLKDSVVTPNIIYPGIQQCVQPTANSPVLSNCKYYVNKIINNIVQQRCLQCEFQYTSKIQIESTVSSLDQCQQYTQCNSKKYIAGLDLVWVKIFSCHICNDNTQIPVAFMEMTSIDRPYPKNFRRYTLSSLSHIDDTQVNSINIQCMAVNAQNLGYDTNTSSQMQYYKNLPDNCALGVVNLNVTDGDARLNQTIQVLGVQTVKVAHFCAACKPGYKGTQMNDVFSYIKVKCQLIEHCIGLDWFNQCSQCSTGYIYEFSNGQINYDICISNNIQNCYAADKTGKCIFCQRGYFLNRDYNCEQIKPVNCQDNDHFNFRVQYTQRTLSYGLYHGYTGVGCSKCQTGYKAILQTSLSHSYQCINSTYIQQNYQNLQDNTLYIKNCINYGFVTDQIICQKCTTGYVRNQNALKCYIGSNDCELSTSDNVCFKCKDNIFLINGKCLSNQISNCKTPNNDENNSQPKCKVCLPSYYITSDFKCEFGQVSNCEIYKQFQSKKCEKCLDGYALYIGITYDYCYQLDTSLNCKDAELKSNSVYGASLQCTKCISPNYILTTQLQNNINSTICMQFQIVDNCLIYDKAETLQNSTLRCLQCQKDYFLASESSCILRKNNSTTCKEYNQNLDSCIICQEQFYIDPQGLCKSNPSGIAYCNVYENDTTCKHCQPDYYLVNNQCLQIPSDKLVSGCLHYRDQNICEKCKENYVLVGQTCESAEAKNCLTYTSPKKCESCYKGYVLETIGDIINCKLYNKANCIEFDQVGDYPCLKCQPHYYPDSLGQCQAVNPRITNCKVYASNDICQQCDSGLILNSSGTQCLNLSNINTTYDVNCDSFKNKIDCAICEPGFYFQKQQCLKCQANNCFYCHPADSSKCQICQTDYYMTQQDQINIDNYPPEAKLYVETLQREFSEMLKNDPHVNNTWTILRFLRARQFDIEKTRLMFGNFLKARQERNMKSLAQVDFPKELMEVEFVRGYYYCTKQGHPIFVDPVGSQNVKKLLEDYKDNLDYIRDYYWSYQERVVNIILTKASEQAGKRIDKIVVILDLKGLNVMKIFNSNFKKIMKITTEVTQDLYPEFLEKMIIINAPFVFKPVWSFVKVLIDKKTANKIIIETGNGQKQISKLVDYDKLPVVIGGTCDIPIYDNPGCWQKQFNKSFIHKTLYLKDDELFNKYFLTEEEKSNLKTEDFQQDESTDYIGQLKEIEPSIIDKELVQNHVKVRFPK